MYKVILLPLAKEDIREAALWYNNQQLGLGKRFTNEIRKKVVAIRENPFAFSIRYHNVRTANIDIFPFMIHFVVEEDAILISSVFHTSLDPNKWSKR